MKDIVIIGAGGFGREVAWLIEDINKVNHEWNIVGFVDDNAKLHGKKINGYKIIGGIELLKNMEEVYVSFGLGSPKIKEFILNRLKEFNNIKFTNLIHPSVIIAPYSELGEGNIICANNILSVNSKILNNVTVNLGCTIGHDVVLEDFVTVSPGVNLSGFVTVKKGADVGTGSSVVQGLTIGENTVIGAGAVVVNNLPESCTAVGAPAKPIKFHKKNS